MRCVEHPRSATNTTDIDPFSRLRAADSGRRFSFKPRASAGGGHPGRGAALTVAPRRASPYPRLRLSEIRCLGSGPEKFRVALREPDSGLPRMLESGRRIGGQQSRLETNFVGLDAGLGKPVAT